MSKEKVEAGSGITSISGSAKKKGSKKKAAPAEEKPILKCTACGQESTSATIDTVHQACRGFPPEQDNDDFTFGIPWLDAMLDRGNQIRADGAKASLDPRTGAHGKDYPNQSFYGGGWKLKTTVEETFASRAEEKRLLWETRTFPLTMPNGPVASDYKFEGDYDDAVKQHAARHPIKLFGVREDPKHEGVRDYDEGEVLALDFFGREYNIRDGKWVCISDDVIPYEDCQKTRHWV